MVKTKSFVTILLFIFLLLFTLISPWQLLNKTDVAPQQPVYKFATSMVGTDVLLSIKHEESGWAIEKLVSEATYQGGKLTRRGNGDKHGDVRIFVAGKNKNPDTVFFVILYTVNDDQGIPRILFYVVDAEARILNGTIPQESMRVISHEAVRNLPKNISSELLKKMLTTYFFPKTMRWSCSWLLSRIEWGVDPHKIQKRSLWYVAGPDAERRVQEIFNQWYDWWFEISDISLPNVPPGLPIKKPW